MLLGGDVIQQYRGHGGRLSVGGQDLICLCNGECNKLNWPLAAIVCLFWLCWCMGVSVCVCRRVPCLEACCAYLSDTSVLFTPPPHPTPPPLRHVTEVRGSLAKKTETLLPLMPPVTWITDHVREDNGRAETYRWPLNVGRQGVSSLFLFIARGLT